MRHCHEHFYPHHECRDCRRAAEREDEATSTGVVSSILDAFNTSSESTFDTSTPDSSSDFGGFDGGDSGGGGASGDF